MNCVFEETMFNLFFFVFSLNLFFYFLVSFVLKVDVFNAKKGDLGSKMKKRSYKKNIVSKGHRFHVELKEENSSNICS